MKMNKKWFTLIEMLIVIVIIGILAAALIPRLTAVQGRARDVARKSDLQQISTALATYNLDNGTYPASTAETTDAAGFASALSWLVSANLMKSLPKEAAQWANHPYQYRTFNSASTFTLKALSEWGWVNANYATSFPTLSGSNASIITQLLCTSVGQWSSSYTTWSNCTADVVGLAARYVVAN